MTSLIDVGSGSTIRLADPVDIVPLWELAENGAGVPDILITAHEAQLAWMSEGACSLADPELFFPEIENSETAAAAKALCATCPVLADCERYISAIPFAEFGIWAGTTTNERQDMNRKRFNTTRNNVGA